MKPGSSIRPETRRTIAVTLLSVGLASALTIVLTAPADPGPDGTGPTDSKRFLREMEVFGGKANLLASEARLGLEGLFQGRALGGTVAVLTLAAVFLFWLATVPLPPGGGGGEGPGPGASPP